MTFTKLLLFVIIISLLVGCVPLDGAVPTPTVDPELTAIELERAKAIAAADIAEANARAAKAQAEAEASAKLATISAIVRAMWPAFLLLILLFAAVKLVHAFGMRFGAVDRGKVITTRREVIDPERMIAPAMRVSKSGAEPSGHGGYEAEHVEHEARRQLLEAAKHSPELADKLSSPKRRPQISVVDGEHDDVIDAAEAELLEGGS